LDPVGQLAEPEPESAAIVVIVMAKEAAAARRVVLPTNFFSLFIYAYSPYFTE